MGGRERLKTDLAQQGLVGIDSSVLIYHLEDLLPYSELTEMIFSSLAEGDLAVAAVISTISVTELLVKPFAEGEEEKIKVFESFLQGLPHTTMVAPSYEIAKGAARLRGLYGLRTPDAIMLSTALSEGARGFLTNDEELRKVEGEGIAILILDDYLNAD